MSGCVGLRFEDVVKALTGSQARFVSVVGVDRHLFGYLAGMRFLVEFGLGQSGMYSVIPLYDYENGFFVGFLWSGRERKREIEEIIWVNHFARGKYPVDFYERALRRGRGLPVTYGSLKQSVRKEKVLEAVRFLGIPRLRLVIGPDGEGHSLSAVGFVMSGEQVHIVLHASLVTGCVYVEEGSRVMRKIWLHGMKRLALTEAEIKYYVARTAGNSVSVIYVKERANVPMEFVSPLIRGRGSCGTYLVLTPIKKRWVPGDVREAFPLVLGARNIDSADNAEKIVEEHILPSLFVLAADMSAENIKGCFPQGLKQVCYTRASPLEAVRQAFTNIYEKLRNTFSQHLISSRRRPYRGPEPDRAFDIALKSCKYCIIDDRNNVLITPTISDALRIDSLEPGRFLVGPLAERDPVAAYLRAVKTCGVIV